MPTTPARRARGTDAAARILLDRLGRAVEVELRRRRISASLEPAGIAPVEIERLSSITRDLPNLATLASKAALALTRINRGDVARGMRGAVGFLDRRRQLRDERVHGRGGADDFGFDEEWTDTLLPIVNLLYDKWWRVQVRGVENVPATGRALLVANHAGVFPYDGAMIRLAVHNEHPQPRHIRALVLNGLFGTPFASWFVRRTGNTLANNHDAEALLRRDEVVLVFPEGSKGPGKLYRDRYRLRRFGRGGFVELAWRTQTPIIPISVVGSEEIHPMLADIPALARATNQPYFPITPTLPWLGPLGLVPLPSSWIIEFHPPISVPPREGGSGLAPGATMRISDAVRDTIQQGVYANLERRGSVFAS